MIRVVTASDVRLIEPMRAPRRRFGVPLGGPFDSEAFAVCQAFAEGSIFEVGYAGGEFSVDRGVVLVGADRSVSFAGTGIPSSGVAQCSSGVLVVGPARKGVTTYLGDSASQRTFALEPPRSLASATLRILPGPQSALFDLEEFSGIHEVTIQSNRVGIRLRRQPSLGHSHELPSEPQCVGAIQVTPDGTPIIIGPDGPTIGGYPKIAVVISADLPKLGQLGPLASIRFEVINMKQAQMAALEAQTRLERRLAELRVYLRNARL